NTGSNPVRVIANEHASSSDMLVFSFCLLLSERVYCRRIIEENVERFFILLRCFDKFQIILTI
ncbi:hypothetical protein, partial [Geobacillus thermodenitrificans]|uniref:hypothetical protein n=1 Tax=Geobacillus thermodenitrificans TaxID=33940 RepID=UPI000553EE75